MKINIVKSDNISETEITINCRFIDKELEDIISAISLAGNTFAGKINNETYFISVPEIYYFETVDNKTFFYTKDEMYETPLKIYQIEATFADTTLVRVSKSIIANLKKIKSIKTEHNSRLIARLINDEKIIISRQYMKDIKARLGL